MVLSSIVKDAVVVSNERGRGSSSVGCVSLGTETYCLSVLTDFRHGLMQRSVHYVFITKPLVMNLTAIYHIRNKQCSVQLKSLRVA